MVELRMQWDPSGQRLWRRASQPEHELGINRVAVRAGFTAGSIVVTAARAGLRPARVQIASKPVKVVDGISTLVPQRLAAPV
jgi:hypothetical protein